MTTYHAFKTIPIFEQFLRCKNWKEGELDYITLDGKIYTMHSFDDAGKRLEWANKKLDTIIVCETQNRYDKSIGFTDAKVWKQDNWGMLRDDITYAE